MIANDLMAATMTAPGKLDVVIHVGYMNVLQPITEAVVRKAHVLTAINNKNHYLQCVRQPVDGLDALLNCTWCRKTAADHEAYPLVDVVVLSTRSL